MTTKTILGAGVALALLAACAERDVILPGERVGIRDGLVSEPAPLVNEARPIALPAARVTTDWTHRSGSPTHDTGHLSLSATPTLLFSAPIGQGDSRRNRIMTDPVIGGGIVYTIDAASTLTATTTAGARVWSVDLTPAGEGGSASGGGIAVAGDTVYVTNGYGELIALDTANGGVRWRQDMNASGGGAPTVVGDLVYVVSRDSRGWAVERGNGRVRWTVDGIPSITGVGSGAGVAVADGLTLFPFPSGQVIATFAEGGASRWTAVVTGERLGRAAANIVDITADPVISGGTVYVGNFSGRIAALSMANGERLWTATEGATGPMAVTGGSLFAVSDINELVRIDAATGDVIWRQPLPDLIERRFGKARAAHAHYGPLVTGGRVVVASSDGILRSYDPVSGALVGETVLPDGAASQPAIVNGVLYVVSTTGKLLAFR